MKGCLLPIGSSVMLFSSVGLFGRRRNVFLKPERNFFFPFDVGDNSGLGEVSRETLSPWRPAGFGLLVASSTCSDTLISGVHKSGDGAITFGERGGITRGDSGGVVLSSGIEGVLD